MIFQWLKKFKTLIFASGMAALLVGCDSNKGLGPSPTASLPPATSTTATPIVTTAPAGTTAAGATPTVALKVVGKVLATQGATTNVHDPAMIKDGDTYYLFSTGPGILIHCSKDMLKWNSCGRVFATYPDWIKQTIPDVVDVWAPDISFHAGKFYLYYAASSFGSNHSAIGLATTATLNPDSPNYNWQDQGKVISSETTDNFNTIDPNLAYDKDGQPWLAFGSFWSGLKLVKLDSASLKPAAGAALISVANNPGSDAVEAPFIVRRDDYYYLFVSHDYCCKGVMSSYNIRVGRSRDIAGPYLDRTGSPMIGGGGTLVYAGSSRWRGPGGNSVYVEGGNYYLVYHSYDADFEGTPTLRIETLSWDQENWPLAPSAALKQ